MRARLPFLITLSVSAATASCLDALNKYGVNEDITVKSSVESPTDPLADDQIADKHPVFDATRTVVQTFETCTFTFNLSSSVIKLDVVDPNDNEKPFMDTLYPTYAKAAEAVGATIPTVDAVGNALKTFDDALYAAVETAAEDASSGSPIAKKTLYADMTSQLLSASQASGANSAFRAGAVSMGAAMVLGGDTPDSSILTESQALAHAFRTSAETMIYATPTAFYDRSTTLSNIFTRDRFLMYGVGGLDTTTVAAATILPAGTSLRKSYDAVTSLYAGVTNPSRHFSLSAVADVLSSDPFNSISSISASLAAQNSKFLLGDECGASVKWLPPSDAPEDELYRQYVCNGDGTPPTDFLNTLVTAVLNGTIDLSPKAGSGWYAQQLYALEVLLSVPKQPEGQHLLLTKRYKQKLVETFKTLYTQTRDTHAKQVEMGDTTAGSITTPTPVRVTPQLVAEPLATYYLRQARGYVFVENILDAALTKSFLDQAYGIGEGGTLRTTTLRTELHYYERLLYGLHALTADSIGLEHAITSEELASIPLADSEAEATAWLAKWKTNADFAADPRVAVPVAVDKTTNKVTYWVVIGAKVMPSEASYYSGYEPTVVKNPNNCEIVGYDPQRTWLLVGKTIEIQRSITAPVLTRTLLRSLLDGKTTEAAAQSALEAP